MQEKEEFKVTPWAIEGKVDYDKLIKQFGTTAVNQEILEKLKNKTKSKKLHHFFTRGFIYSHRDFDKVLDGIEKNNFFIYTGRGPSGKMHIGHLIPFMISKWFQDEFDCNVYIAISDDEKFVFKDKLTFEEMEKTAKDNFLDISAVGLNPNNTFFFSDVEFISKLYPVALKFSKKINFSTAKAVFGFNNESNLGQFFYPAVQIVPTTFENKHCLIPAGIDQDPYWRIQRDVAEKLGYKKVTAVHNKLLPPLQGLDGKMSSSVTETAIFLDDDEKTVLKKINKYAFSGGQPTVEEQREKGGNTDICVVYSWLEILFEEDDEKLLQRKKDCRSGKILCGECKKYLAEKISKTLRLHQENKIKNTPLIDKYKYSGELAKVMWK